MFYGELAVHLYLNYHQLWHQSNKWTFVIRDGEPLSRMGTHGTEGQIIIKTAAV